MPNEELDEAELFNSAVSDEPIEAEQTEQVEPDKPETEAVAETLAEGEKPAVDDNAAQVPSWRVREINEEKRRFAEENERIKAELAELRRAQQQQKPAEKTEPKDNDIDPLLDPKGYAKQVRDEIRQEMLSERREESLQRASKAYKDEFKEAYEAAQKRVDPALRARMQESRDPGETLIEWHREQKTMKEVGSDPNAWLEKKLEERLNDPAFLAKAIERANSSARQAPPSNGRPRVELPPSLNGASRSNAALQADSNDLSDRELFNQVAG